MLRESCIPASHAGCSSSSVHIATMARSRSSTAMLRSATSAGARIPTDGGRPYKTSYSPCSRNRGFRYPIATRMAGFRAAIDRASELSTRSVIRPAKRVQKPHPFKRNRGCLDRRKFGSIFIKPFVYIAPSRIEYSACLAKGCNPAHGKGCNIRHPPNLPLSPGKAHLPPGKCRHGSLKRYGNVSPPLRLACCKRPRCD